MSRAIQLIEKEIDDLEKKAAEAFQQAEKFKRRGEWAITQMEALEADLKRLKQARPDTAKEDLYLQSLEDLTGETVGQPKPMPTLDGLPPEAFCFGGISMNKRPKPTTETWEVVTSRHVPGDLVYQDKNGLPLTGALKPKSGLGMVYLPPKG